MREEAMLVRTVILALALLVAGCPHEETTGDDDTAASDDDTQGQYDLDGDGWTVQDGDCSDADPATYPGADEVCDGTDNDCDGEIPSDELDEDQDGYRICEGDCDDASQDTRPSASEICDGADNDCDGTLPDDEADEDGDGVLVCEDDCDDGEASVYPGAEEVCGDGLDNDCDGTDNECLLAGTIALEDADAILIGEGHTSVQGDEAGVALSGMNDLDGDGIDDLAVTALGYHDFQGSTYLVAGLGSGPMSLGNANAKVVGELEGDDSGRAVSIHGDANGDGLADVLIGAPGESTNNNRAGAAYVLYSPLSGEDDLGNADAKLLGVDEYDEAGTSLDFVGDLDGDGYDDLIVGAPTSWFAGPTGRAYVIHGPVSGTIELATVSAQLLGEGSGDQAGCSVASAGDVNGDGQPDVLVGAHTADGNLEDDGAAYLFGRDVTSAVDLATADAKFVGEALDDMAGSSVASAGDVDGDGLDDILIGARCAVGAAAQSGVVYLVHGPVSGTMSLASADARFLGEFLYQEVGMATSSAGDVDGDGHDDILVGSYTADGRAYLVYGPVAPGDHSLSDADAVFITEESTDDYAGWSVAPAGDLDGDGYDDIAIGAFWAYDEYGAAYVMYGRPGM